MGLQSDVCGVVLVIRGKLRLKASFLCVFVCAERPQRVASRVERRTCQYRYRVAGQRSRR